MDLQEAAADLVADYSHGMRKKIALAAALLPAPRLLFLDEPFEGIDADRVAADQGSADALRARRRHGVPDLAHPRDRRAAVRSHRHHPQGPDGRAGVDWPSCAPVAMASHARRALHRAGRRRARACRRRSTGSEATMMPSILRARSPGCDGGFSSTRSKRAPARVIGSSACRSPSSTSRPCS